MQHPSANANTPFELSFSISRDVYSFTYFSINWSFLSNVNS